MKFGKTKLNSKPPVGAQLDRNHPLARGMTAALLLNDGVGVRPTNLATLGRCTPYAANGTGLIWVSTPYGPAIKHDNAGTGDFDSVALQLDSAAIPVTSTNQKFSILVRWYHPSSGSSTIFRDVVPSGGIQFRIDGDGTLSLLRAAQFGYTNSTGVVSVGYNDLGIVYGENGTYTYYINGKAAGGGNTSGTIASNPIALGGRGGFSESAQNGSYSVWAYIWNRTLSATEVASISTDPYQMVVAPSRRYLSLYVAGGGSTTNVNDTDVASLSEAQAVTVQTSATDTASLSEVQAVAASTSATDSASLSETSSLSAQASASDTTTVTESQALTLAPVADSAALSEASGLTAVSTASDSAATTEVSGLTSAAADVAVLTEATGLAVTLGATDTLALAEASLVTTEDAPADTDSAGLAESTGLSATSSATDSANLTEAGVLVVVLGDTDGASVVESHQLVLSAADVITADEAGVVTPAALLFGDSDGVGVSEAASLVALFGQVDSATLSEAGVAFDPTQLAVGRARTTFTAAPPSVTFTAVPPSVTFVEGE